MSNPVLDKIRRIYQSFDFRGNKIFGAKVDTPSKTDDKLSIVNRDYVDKEFQFKPELSFPTLLNQHLNKVLNYLLFDTNHHLNWTKPEVSKVLFTSTDNVNIIHENMATKMVFYTGIQKRISFTITINHGEFISDDNGMIFVIDTVSNQTLSQFRPEQITTITYQPNLKFVYSQTYTKSAPKRNNRNQEVFAETFVLNEDLTPYVKQSVILLDPIKMKIVPNPEQTNISSNDADYNQIAQITYTSPTQVAVDCSVPSFWFENYNLGIQFFEGINNTRLTITEEINLSKLTNVLITPTKVYFRLYCGSFGNQTVKLNTFPVVKS